MPEPDLITAVLGLGGLSLAFGRVERATRHEDGTTPESDTDHTVMLGLIGCSLAPLVCADLDLGLIAQYALVHDVVEVHAGDTNTLRQPDADTKAAKKALEVAKALGEWVLAEDSGLVVPALNGQPGVHSARFAGRQGDDAANNVLLLKKMEALQDDARGAYYVCAAVLANPAGQVQATAEGRCHGRIIRDYRGAGGFGYDPLFLVPEYHQTFGELSLRVKQALSHRGKAITQLRPALRGARFQRA